MWNLKLKLDGQKMHTFETVQQQKYVEYMKESL